MRTIYNALIQELGYEDGKDTFEWYCRTYNLSIEDDAPATIKREVLG